MVRIDEPRINKLSTGVNDLGTGGLDPFGNLDNPVIFNQDIRIFQNTVPGIAGHDGPGIFNNYPGHAYSPGLAI